MKISLQTEQVIACIILVFLLACCIQEKAATNGMKSESVPDWSLHQAKADSSALHEPISLSASLPSSNLALVDISKHVDNRLGTFKSAQYLPNSEAIRFYDDTKVAVRNSLIQIVYQTPDGDRRQNFQKIDVFIKKNGRWVPKTETALHQRHMASL
ncbi:hypothetical protein CLV98_102177 [Dyadobacter jejuensis]|uniref:Uncharacterized protein n=1 Tax=Dyadobacter jejuensis TaxID=1082580 RepID=A0A316AQA8_9BACT|nr:hypothetical protein [Dyadobacter jejuensis]PWJ59344.1 hypothetical protein CLV98_102177 [Dyadobacter jejuensis]